MKTFSIINGVQVAGMSLIALAVVGSLTFRVATPRSSVLSDTTANITMVVTYGDKTLTEMPLTENGFPSFEGGAAAFKIELGKEAPEGTKVEFTTDANCVLFSDGKGGGTFNQSKTDSINFLYQLAVGAVDDDKYEGDHLCKVVAVFTSSDTEINGQKRSITFNIKDNDPKPEGEIAKEKTTEPKETSSTPQDKPGIPTTKLLDKDGKEIEVENSTAKFAQNEEIKIAGTTVSNGQVKLYIFSEPQEASVVADDDGAWTYTIENIEPGEHRVEVEVTDPATGETSDRAQVLAFEVAQTETATVTSANVQETSSNSVAENSSAGLFIAAGTSILLLAVGLLGLIIYKKKHPHHENDYSSETINPSDGMGSGL